MPAGTYMIEASLDTGDRGTMSGVANAGATVDGQNIIIEVQRNATVSGVVRLPDGTAGAEVPVTVGERGDPHVGRRHVRHQRRGRAAELAAAGEGVHARRAARPARPRSS